MTNDGRRARIAHGDIAVVIPGILGSTLIRGRKRVWGYRQVVTNVQRLGHRLTEDLSLPTAAFADPEFGHDDGVTADGMLKTLSILPGFVAMDGYDRLVQGLRTLFAQDADAVQEFPYDWRQSNEHSAARLGSFVQGALVRRREAFPHAKVVLIGHSMGGLVARFFAECLDTRRDTRRVVTIGTPYQGSIKALTLLANGFVRLGPRKFALGELARSLPSVAELLPVYACLGPSPDQLTPIAHESAVSDVPGLPAAALTRSRVFHERLASAIVANGDGRPTYHALLSHWQTTDQWACVDRGGETRPQPSIGFENGGDGTVSRLSATPPEWSDDANGVYIAGRHSTLQQQAESIVQLKGILTAQPRRAQASIDGICVDAAQYAELGEDWAVEATSVEGSDRLVLILTMADAESGSMAPVAEVPVRPMGQGRYRAVVRMHRVGMFRWTIRTSPQSATPVESVSDAVLCSSLD
ncbi:hypothetical protein [Streptomyces sp. SID3343]|uniref:esterase/lipase family protein n=1 Tax=Streptomyces sp. SID3343 TaxID=2690260 RepID=UPI00136993AF|nr:hypothetical protein [Streptomyces sp. SID3343]MYW04638.1 hypothetical protein [Streptomyces sp. SID3343]